MDAYSLRKKVIQISVLSMVAIVLCGCGKWQKQDETMPSEQEICDETVSDEKELPVEPIFDSSSDTSSRLEFGYNRRFGILRNHLIMFCHILSSYAIGLKVKS